MTYRTYTVEIPHYYYYYLNTILYLSIIVIFLHLLDYICISLVDRITQWFPFSVTNMSVFVLSVYNFWMEMINCSFKSVSGSLVCILSWLQTLLVVSYGFTARDRTVFHAICCAWPLRWWSAGRVTPGRICSKSSLLVMGEGGSRAWQHAGGLISPLVKGQIQKA